MYRVNILEGNHSPRIHTRVLVKTAGSKLDAIMKAIAYLLEHEPHLLPDELEHHLYGIKVIELIDFHGSNTVAID